MVKSVKLEDRVGVLLNKAKAKLLLENPNIKKMTDSDVIEKSLQVYINGQRH